MAFAPHDGTVSARRAGHTAAACPPCQGGHRFPDSPHVPAIAEHAGNHHRGGCQFRSRHGPPGRVGNKPAGSTVEYKDERTGSVRSRWRRPRARWRGFSDGDGARLGPSARRCPGPVARRLGSALARSPSSARRRSADRHEEVMHEAGSALVRVRNAPLSSGRSIGVP